LTHLDGRLRSPRARGERGVTLIIFALSIVVLFIISALVIDLSFVRQNRQADKNATDFAAAAGVRELDDGSGLPNVWKGICAARDYLEANNPELTPLTHVDAVGNTIPDPCVSPPTVYCTSTSNWRSYRGIADGGQILVEIHTGYALPDPDFPEDDGAYDGDDGVASSNGCDHIAVIVRETEGSYFGDIVGSTGNQSTIRSVGRLVQGTEGDITAALILLERNDCEVLDISGTGASVRVLGNGVNPGVIHADSLGNGGGCGAKIFDVNGTTPPPRIITENAEIVDPLTTVLAPGQISAVALTGMAGAQPDNDSDGVDHVCAQAVDTDCGATAPVSGDEPSGRELVGRGRVDDRYGNAVIDLRDDADDRFAWSTTNPPPTPEWHIPPGGCNPTGSPFTQAKIFISCDGDFVANGKVFESTVRELVIAGNVKFTGNGTLHIKGGSSAGSVTRVFVKGSSGNALQLNNNRNLLVNDGGLTDSDSDGFVCDQRFASNQSARAEFVIGSGNFGTNGGIMRLCQTTLFMMDGALPGEDCPIPDPDATALAPYDNGCGGYVNAAGGSNVDWSAPNAKSTAAVLPDQTDWDNFEDLAMWSETSAHSGTGWRIGGTGGVTLSGVFFTPNANPFDIGGGGTWNILDAQFITRKLRIVGGGELRMKPEAFNSISIPALKGFTLVR
jgi:hypothetical protein